MKYVSPPQSAQRAILAQVGPTEGRKFFDGHHRFAAIAGRLVDHLAAVIFQETSVRLLPSGCFYHSITARRGRRLASRTASPRQRPTRRKLCMMPPRAVCLRHNRAPPPFRRLFLLHLLQESRRAGIGVFILGPTLPQVLAASAGCDLLLLVGLDNFQAIQQICRETARIFGQPLEFFYRRELRLRRLYNFQ